MHSVTRQVPNLIQENDEAQSQAARLASLAVRALLEEAELTPKPGLHRGGLLALKTAQAGATAVLAAGGTVTARGWRLLQQLDSDLIALNASPGGSADLLAATLFLDFIANSPLTENEPWKN